MAKSNARAASGYDEIGSCANVKKEITFFLLFFEIGKYLSVGTTMLINLCGPSL
jgi:hypothetical protein